MINRHSAEEYFAKLDEVVRQYRLCVAERGEREGLTQEKALERVRKLGFTVGEALRFLRPNGH